MIGFGNRQRLSSRPPIADPLDVIPVSPENVDIRYDSAGNMHLRLTIEAKGIAGAIGKLLGYDYGRKVELDENGTYYYSQVNGRNTLRYIAYRMSSKLGKSRAETEAVVIFFTKKLMVKNFLLLEVPVEEPRNSNG